MFAITDRKGFHMKFANGWTVSVQFGRGNYCSNRELGEFGRDVPPSNTAEIAAWDKDGKWYKNEDWGDDVKGYCGTDEVAEFIALIANQS